MKTIINIMSKHSRLLAAVIILTALCLNISAQSANRLYVPDVMADPGTNVSLSVNLDNTDDIVAAQFYLTVPAYTTIDVSKVQLTDRAQDHVITARLNASYAYTYQQKTYVIVIYSPTNKPFLGNSGAICTADLAVANGITTESSYALTLSSAVVGNAAMENKLTKTDDGKLNVGIHADLTCSNLSLSTSDIVPGEKVTATWKVENIGKLTAKTWKEVLYLESQNPQNSVAIYEKSYNEELTYQGYQERSNEILIPTSVGVEGECTVRLKIIPNKETGEGTDAMTNNETTMLSKVNVSRLLTLSIPLQIKEPLNNEQGYDCMITRSGDRSQAETFSLTCDDSRITVKNQITIDKGSSGQWFQLVCKGNGVYDAKDSITVFATPLAGAADRYSAITKGVYITDDTQPKLTLDIIDKPTGTDADYSITEGDILKLRLTTDYAPAENLTINITCDHPDRFEIPSVVLLAGKTSVDVIIPTIDDDVVNLSEEVIFTASATSYDKGNLVMLLNDNDIPTLQLTLTPDVICESDGANAVEATITRTDNIDKKVTIRITDNSHGQLRYSTQTIEMAKMQQKATFTIEPVDNDIKDGEHTYTIVAAVYTASCDCAAAPVSKSGYISADLVVTDDEGPVLTVVSLNGAAKENETAKLNISRDVSYTDNDVTVTLSSDNESILEYNHSVVIPKNQRDVVVDVKVKSLPTTSAVTTLNMYAKAQGYGRGMVSMVLCNKELPDAEITAFTINPSTVKAGGKANASVTIRNAGNATLDEAYPVDIYLKNEKKIPSVTLYTTKALEPGESETITGEFIAPDATGQSVVTASGNTNNTIEEILTKNNTAEATIDVTAPFTAQLTTDKTQYNQGVTVRISGTTTGERNCNADVEIYVINDNIRDTLTVRTDDNGAFSTTWKPLTGYAGDFTVGACYPGEGISNAMARFSIYGIKIERENEDKLLSAGKYFTTADISIGDTYTQVYVLKNLSSLPLSNIKVETAQLPEGCKVKYSGDKSLAANADGRITVEITGDKRTEIDNWEIFNLVFTTNEGVGTSKEVYYYCRAQKAQLKASITEIKTTMNIDDGKDYIFLITNTGKGQTGDITLSLPSWMKLMSGDVISSLATGEQAEVVIHLSPKDDMQLNVPVTGKIGINCKYGSGLAIDYNVTPVSGKTGRLCVDAMDDYTTYAEGHPHLAGATVNIYAPATLALVATGITGNDGTFTTELPEGYYTFTVSAPKHSSVSGTVLVDADATKDIHPFLSYNAVNYSYSVTETTIEDRYSINQEITFETRVPKPILETKMSDMPYRNHVGYVSVTNIGYIDAYKVSVIVPESSEFMTIEPLAPTYTDTLHAGETLMVPIKVTVNPKYSYDNLPLQATTNGDNTADSVDSSGSTSGAKGVRRAPDNEEDEDDDDEDELSEPCQMVWVKVAYEITECDNETGELIHTGKYDTITKFVFYGNCSLQNLLKVSSIKGTPASKATPGSPGTSWNKGIGDVDFYFTEKIEKALEWLLKPCLNGCDNAVISTITDCIAAVIDCLPVSIFKKAKDAAELFKEAWDMAMCFTGLANDCVMPAIEALTDDKKLDWKDYQLYLSQVTCGASIGGCLGTFGGQLADKGFKAFLGPIYSVLVCIKDVKEMVEKCFKNKGSGTNSKGLRKTAAQPVIDEEHYDLIFDLIDAAQLAKENKMLFFGDEEFLCISEQESERFYDYIYTHHDADGYIIKDDTRYAARPSNITLSQFDNFIDRYNNAMLFAHTGVRSANMIDLDAMIDNTRKMGNINEIAKNAGFEDIHQLMDAAGNAVGELYKKGVEGTNTGECATVKMQFNQDMALTRQAFRGTLILDNSTETDMSDITLTPKVWDSEGYLQDETIMAVTNESAEGFTSATAGNIYALQHGKEGVITVLYIPTSKAAPVQPKTYKLGGTLAYKHGEQNVVIEMTPIPMVIKPAPELTLNYFMQRDVLADDPFTSDKIEPSYEAEFAVLISNNGNGDAQNVRITTAQPQFTENKKGLALDLHFVSTKLNGEEASLPFSTTKPVDYGTIPALSTTYSQWWFTSNLMGHIADYNISLNHVTSYDNPDLSLIKDAKAHVMVRSIEAYPYSTADKKAVGFMANDIEDNQDLPDMMYITDGTQERITSANATTAKVNASDDTRYSLTVTPDGYGWNYGIVDDPTDGKMLLQRVIRNSDGREMPLRNFWQTDRTFPDSRDVKYENRLHFVDYIAGATSRKVLQLRAALAELSLPQETYTLYFVPKPQTTLAVKSFEGAPADDVIANDNPTTISVIFNKAIKAETFTTDDISLTIDGVHEDVSKLVIAPSENDDTYTISLSDLNEYLKETSVINGYYVLTVATADIIDAEGFAGNAGSTVSWYTKYSPATAINNWTSDDTLLIDVYTTGGQKLRSRVPLSTALQGLQRGVYIINRRKYVVR